MSLAPVANAPGPLAVARRGQIIEPAVYAGHFFHPLLPLGVIQIQNLAERPVEVKGQIGYLLPQAIQGVAYAPPRSARSTSTGEWHAGQVAVTVVLPSSLMRR